MRAYEINLQSVLTHFLYDFITQRPWKRVIIHWPLLIFVLSLMHFFLLLSSNKNPVRSLMSANRTCSLTIEYKKNKSCLWSNIWIRNDQSNVWSPIPGRRDACPRMKTSRQTTLIARPHCRLFNLCLFFNWRTTKSVA